MNSDCGMGDNVAEETNSLQTIAYIVGIPLAFVIIYYILYVFYNRKRKETKTPTRFRFVESHESDDNWEYQFEGNVVVRCRKTKGIRKIIRRLIPIPEFGMWRLRDLMLDLYGLKFGGRPEFQVPNDVLTISIPRNNFRCKGEFSTDFEPKDGVIGDYTYEMICSSVQATWFHFNETKYLAGICIFMDNRYHPLKIMKEKIKKILEDLRIYQPNPANFKEKLMKKTWCGFRNQWIIITQNEFGEVDKFAFNGQENQMELVKCPDCSLETTIRLMENTTRCRKTGMKPIPNLDFSKFLKVEFCEKNNDLVMIGKGSNGRISHFDWDSDLGKFKVQFCFDCETNAERRFKVSDEMEDAPPSYEFLELIELTQN
uniref:FBA_2 domain-containing protein n=1 Tax=Caenorhabditis tropicalis TaxID=1561998 RepID=A0A1I7T873_9PELO